jgi:hypothetical protein
MTYWLKLSDDRFNGPDGHWLALPFDWLWNFPFVAYRLWKSWRRQYGS